MKKTTFLVLLVTLLSHGAAFSASSDLTLITSQEGADGQQTYSVLHVYAVNVASSDDGDDFFHENSHRASDTPPGSGNDADAFEPDNYRHRAVHDTIHHEPSLRVFL